MPQLPKDKDLREDLLLAVEDLKDHKAYLVVQDRLQTLLQNTQRQLESEIQTPLFRRLQGEALGLRKAIRVLDDIEKELKQET